MLPDDVRLPAKMRNARVGRGKEMIVDAQHRLIGRIEILRAGNQTPAVLGDIRVAEQDLIKFKNQLASLQKEWSQIEAKAREDKVPGTWLQ